MQEVARMIKKDGSDKGEEEARKILVRDGQPWVERTKGDPNKKGNGEKDEVNDQL